MISEIDIKDWEHTTEPLKLYEVPRGSVVSATEHGQWFNFDHIDGAYSFCKIFGTDNIVHLSASTEVFVWKKK